MICYVDTYIYGQVVEEDIITFHCITARQYWQTGFSGGIPQKSKPQVEDMWKWWRRQG